MTGVLQDLKMNHSLVIDGITISSKNNLYRLNDLHKAAGGKNTDRPQNWLAIEQTQELVKFLEDEKLASDKKQILTIIKGGNLPQGTYVCKELVYSYAMWISPQFHVAVIRAYDVLVNNSYQYDAALERFRKVMLLENPSEWQQLYTEEFYKPIMRLFNWKFESNKGGLPNVIGMITRQWVYEIVCPKEILDEIDTKRESEKIHQWFNADGGRQGLIHQIAMVSGIAKTCQTYNEFKIKAGCVFNNTPLQIELF